MAFDPALLIGWYAVFIFSATLHEAAHAWVARLGGDDTAYAGGQVSLNPLPHIRREPFGMVVFPAISLLLVGWPLGYASAPYDPNWADRHPQRAALMALAGPLSNLLVALLAVFAMWIGIQSGDFVFDMSSIVHVVSAEPESLAQGLSLLLSMLLVMNFLLFLLNIMPVPPLDGSGVLPLFMSERALARYREVVYTPIGMVIGFLLMWQLVGFLFWPTLGFLLQLLY